MKEQIIYLYQIGGVVHPSSEPPSPLNTYPVIEVPISQLERNLETIKNGDQSDISYDGEIAALEGLIRRAKEGTLTSCK